MEKHPEVKFGKTGVLIINLGTPDSTKWLDIRKYLKEFLSDKRVIEVNPILWQLILNIIILNLRPSKTAKAYKENLDEGCKYVSFIILYSKTSRKSLKFNIK